MALSTGNVVITSPFDDAGGTDAGAVYLFNGSTGALISTLRGSRANDRVGSEGATALANGNYVVHSPNWSNGAAANAGAVTWGNGVTGVAGIVSAANSLVGSRPGDKVGYDEATGTARIGVTPLSNGNYVVVSPNWDNGVVGDAGAATWGSGATGVSGVVSAANSLVGSRADDLFAIRVTELANGNYVVSSPLWDNGGAHNAGAVTWGSGTTGVSGVISGVNSLVGSTAGDQIGNAYYGYGVSALSNGNYVVVSPHWDNSAIVDAGAATWGSGTTGVSGVVSAVNSLVGSTAGDEVGYFVTALTNGNYVVASNEWDNGDIVNAGAATWGDGTTGVTGVASIDNSLIGTTADDRVGGAVALTNGNYVVASGEWDNGAIVNAGAATWCDGTTGVTGLVSIDNSLIGTTADDRVGGVLALTNGNYVVVSPGCDAGGVVDAGAATWCDGTTGVTGFVSTANSLVGSTPGDRVGGSGALALANGNYVVVSEEWDNGGAAGAGAATWGDGTTGVTGFVSAGNSLVGSTTGDAVGGTFTAAALSNGNYVVSSPWWDNGGFMDAGAVTWGDGTTGVTGVVSAANSLVGSGTFQYVGGWDRVTTLSNGNYVVVSTDWHNDFCCVGHGAVTWGSGTTGVTGVVSAANSLIGSSFGDFVGGSGVTTFSNGDYVVGSANWDGALVNAGAATWGDGTTGVSGVISAANSLVGATSNADMHLIVADDVNHTFIASFLGEGGGRVRVGPLKPTTAVGSGIPPAFALDVRPNPTSGKGLRVGFALPTGAYARLQLLDVSGRRVLEREVGSLGAGRHTVNLAEGRRVVPGIYWVRLTQGANQRARRVAVIE